MIYTIQISSELEWSSLKSLIQISNFIPTPFGESFSYLINGKNCMFFHAGASKTKSSAACQFAINNWNPVRHFLIGTAGGVASYLKEGEIIIADKTGLYDYIFRMGEPYEFIPIETIVKIDNSWIDFTKLSKNILFGFIASADQDVDFETRVKLINENVIAADWESGSVSIICSINKIPCTIIRGITDIPYNSTDENRSNQGIAYFKNTPLVIEKIFTEILLKVL
jgi:nucleoside phosphorylase